MKKIVEFRIITLEWKLRRTVAVKIRPRNDDDGGVSSTAATFEQERH